MSQNLYNLRQYDFISFYRQFPDEIRHFSKSRNFPVRISDYMGHSSLVDQKLKSSTFGKHSLKHCKISKGSSNREKSRSRCLRLLVGMLNFSLMMEYGGRSGKRVKFLFEEISSRSSSGHASESSSMKLSSIANK